MPKRSRIAKDIIEQLERAHIQIIPRDAENAHIRGDLGAQQLHLLLAVMPDLKAHWSEVLSLLSNRDENEAAAATLRIIGGEENPAVLLGRRGGLKGGPARAAKMTKKERSESARKAARARWGAR